MMLPRPLWLYDTLAVWGYRFTSHFTRLWLDEIERRANHE